MGNTVIIIGAGLGGLTAALRLARRGYQVEMVEKQPNAGGRLNQIKKDGFTFDMGPTFFSMTYEFDEFIKDAGIDIPFIFRELDVLYTVHFRGTPKKYIIYKDLDKLAAEFKEVEPDFRKKMDRFLQSSERFFHDVEYKVLKRNYDNIWDYLLAMAKVPPHHAPRLWRSVWNEMEKHFQSREVKEIFSLVAFFLGATPFDTPAIYSILSYTELVHDGYHNVEGGMYKITEGLLSELKKQNITIHYNTEIVDFRQNKGKITSMIDHNGKEWKADIFLVNSDAAWFRGKVLNHAAYTEEKLDKMQWTLAPLTLYLGINKKIDDVPLHNYFLGDNFEEYSKNVFKNSVTFEKPYYYVNVVSRSDPASAPEGMDSLFVLCPVPDLRFKPDWSDKDEIVSNILNDLSERMNIDLKKHLVSQTVLTPEDWGKAFNLYKGSGLGLGHSLKQTAGLRPKNFDEKYKNVYYVGASTIPGTGLPMAVISSKLVVERITKNHGLLHA
ncbi:MAG: phytoene desaturase family protein [bacterium]